MFLGFLLGMFAMYVLTGLLFRYVDYHDEKESGFKFTTKEKLRVLAWPYFIWLHTRDPFWD